MPEERRLVTVLFADVAGSTTLGEDLDPEDLRALLGRYYGIAKDVVTAHGGTLEKFIGDAVMAVFGLTRAHGDDASRALDAAIALRDQVRADPRLGEQLPIRIGLNTGQVVASRDAGSGDFLITGDAVNTAARIQQLAEPWAVVCGERTARAAGDAFSFGAPLSLDARGKSRPVRALPVLGRATARPLPRIPLFGRDDDLAQLELTASRAFKERRPFLVSVIAPAGTGKSRLLEEFLDRLPGRAPGAGVAIAQCLPYGQRLTYWPLRGILYRLASIPDDADPTDAKARIVQWLGEMGASDAGATAHRLAATLGLAEADAVDSSEVFAAWRTAIEVAARRDPHVVVFEDLHWSSDSLLDLVEYVMQPRSDTPVLMVVLTRPELLDRRPAWGGGRRNHLALSLEPLDRGAIADLVRHLLESARPELIDRIVERSEGNPFYAGELVRSLVERLGPRADPAAIDAALKELPDTVQATVLARLDLLTADERRAVQVASVFGRGFRPAGVEAIEPALGGRASEICEALAEKDLVRPAGADGFVFRHILIREVAYQTLPRAERARLHAAAAAVLERDATGREDEVAELIAYHYREAAQLAGSLEDRAAVEDVKANAVRWLSRAAESAAAAAASLEATRHLRAAIELADPAEQADLYLRLGETSSSGVDNVAAFLRAYELYGAQGAGPDRELAALARFVGFHLRSPGAVGERPAREAMDAYRARAAELALRASDPDSLARHQIAQSFYTFWLATFTQPTDDERAAAEDAGSRGYEAALGLGDARLQSAALDGLAGVALQRGTWRRAHELNLRRLDLLDRVDVTERIDTLTMLVWGSSMLGDLDQADTFSARGLASVQPGQSPAWVLHLLAWRTFALMLRGDWDEVMRLGARMTQVWEDIARPPAGYAMRGLIAALDVARARQDAPAVERLSEALGVISAAFSTHRNARLATLYLGDDVQAIVTMADGMPLEANNTLEYLERAYARASDVALHVDEASAGRILSSARFSHLPLVQAQLHRAVGVGSADRGALERALALYESAGAIPYVARVRCELALLSGDMLGFDEGARVLESLGDKRQLKEYDRRRV